jgi:hypothetical protein
MHDAHEVGGSTPSTPTASEQGDLGRWELLASLGQRRGSQNRSHSPHEPFSSCLVGNPEILVAAPKLVALQAQIERTYARGFSRATT